MRWQRATTWLVLAFAGCATAPTVPEPVPDVELFVLGVAQAGGLPHLGCDRACCTEARRTGRLEYPVSLGVRGARARRRTPPTAPRARAWRRSPR